MNTKISTKNLIATSDPNAFVGAIVMWHLSGDIDYAAFKDAWRDNGLHPDLLPNLPSPQVCLTRAVEEQAKGERFKRRIKGEGAGGYRLIREDNADQDLADYDTECIVYLDESHDLVVLHYERDKDGALKLDKKDGEPVVSHKKHPLEDDLKAAFKQHEGQLSHRDVSPWLCGQMMDYLKATTLKSNGGAYFVPREQMELLKKIKTALESVSGHKIYTVQAMTTAEAVELVLDAIVREAEAEAKSIEADIAQGHGEDDENKDVKPLGPRALESRADRCRSMVNKVKVYEELLGQRLDAIRGRLDDLKAAAMEASLAARAANKKDKKAA